MRQTHSPVIYLLFVTAAHLVLLTVLWTRPHTDLTPSLTPISVAHPITATFLNTTPQQLQQIDSQAAPIKHLSTSRLVQSKAVPFTAKPVPFLRSARAIHSLPQQAPAPSKPSPLIDSAHTKQAATSTFAMSDSTHSATPISKASPNNRDSLTKVSPRLLHTVRDLDCRVTQPHYPLLSRRHEEVGTTLVRIVVNTYGTIEQATVVQSSGSHRLDYAAREAALASICRPYQLNGQPLRAAVNLRFKFSLFD